MARATPNSTRRYRRRIAGVGAAVLAIVFVVGAAIFVPVVQNDLEDRVEDELDSLGIAGVTASFSGQDGTLSCAEPLGAPNDVADVAEAVDGVRVIGLDRTCIDAAAGVGGVTDPPPDSAGASDSAPPTASAAETAVEATTTSTTDAPPVTEPDVDSIAAIVSTDPLFGELEALLAVAELDGDDALGGDGPFTLLAPTDLAFDAAFDRWGADTFNALVSDPELLRTVLLHHVVDQALSSDDFEAGPITMLDDTVVTVDLEPDGVSFASGGAVATVDDPTTQLDIQASNGVVHAIDRLLIPDGVDLSVESPDAVVTNVSSVDGRTVSSGVVSDEAQRLLLVTAAQALSDSGDVVDELVVDGEAAVEVGAVERLAALVGAFPGNVVSGEAVLSGNELTVVATVRDEAALLAVEQVVEAVGATADLSLRPVADAESAAALQAELNEFVAATPILFEAGSDQLTAESQAVLDQVATRVLGLGSATFTVIGHTDSAGDPGANQVLSRLRAESVIAALVARGVDPATLVADGRGSAAPILDATGAEDAARSRRVEFAVAAS